MIPALAIVALFALLQALPLWVGLPGAILATLAIIFSEGG